MTPGLIIDRLHELADRARRLPPPHPGRPDAFHEARDELAKDIAAVARDVAGLGEALTPVEDVAVRTAARGPGRMVTRTITVGGRPIAVQTPRPAFAL